MSENSIEVTDIEASADLDKITVFWRNWEIGKGAVTVICYGSAWTSYFNAMSGRTIQHFFSEASSEYLAGKLIDYRFQKRSRAHFAYLEKIVLAIQASIGKGCDHA